VLRTVFVIFLLTAGWLFAFQSTIYALCLYLWIAYFRPDAWAWNSVFRTLDLSYIAGIYLLIRAAMSPSRFKLDFRATILFLFLLHALACALFSVDRAYSLTAWEDFAKSAIIAYLISILVSDLADMRLVLTVIALSLGFEAAKQGWATLILNPGGVNENGLPFLGDNNGVAVGMMMLTPVLAALAATATIRWQRLMFQFLTIGVVYRSLSTYSRGGFLTAACIALVYFLRSQKKLRTAMAMIVLAAIVLPVLPAPFWQRMSTITATSDEERDGSQRGRLHYWYVATLMARDRPLSGVGFDAYNFAYPNYNEAQGTEYEGHRSVHSAWFGALAELGYPGLVLMVLIVGLSVRACRRVRRKALQQNLVELSQYATAVEISFFAFAVGGSFLAFQYNEMLWHFIGLSMALERIAATCEASVPAAVPDGAVMSRAAATWA
jgi:probable O-glycosylation ligase (exosortase A-associated)